MWNRCHIFPLNDAEEVRMSMRFPRVAALSAATALVLAGCGGVGGGDDEGVGGAVTLTTMGFGLGDEIATVRADLANKAIEPAKVKVSENAFDPQQFLSA